MNTTAFNIPYVIRKNIVISEASASRLPTTMEDIIIIPVSTIAFLGSLLEDKAEKKLWYGIVFFFARENRPPVLGWINDSEDRYFAVDYGEDTVTLAPVFFDPDEDTLNISVLWSTGKNGSVLWRKGEYLGSIPPAFTSPTISGCGGICYANITINDSFFVDSQRISFEPY